ncbi:MAG: FeGP cofactor biosynthesis protein HcgF family protein, partial [Methanothermobacter sp.]
MLKVATAECFTHGLIAREIHALSQGYDGKFGCSYLR